MLSQGEPYATRKRRVDIFEGPWLTPGAGRAPCKPAIFGQPHLPSGPGQAKWVKPLPTAPPRPSSHWGVTGACV
eukprot:3174475-Pyramimonas_sp.AAC.2